MPRYMPPVIVSDFDHLDSQIADHIVEFQFAEETEKTYRKGWKAWVRHCERLGCDPENAPFEAYEDLLVAIGESGLPISNEHLGNVLRAVEIHHEKRGTVASHQLKENAASWAQLRRGRRKVAELDKHDRVRAVPLPREHVAQLLRTALTTARPTSAPVTLLRSVAVALVQLDTDWDPADGTAARIGDI